MKPKIYIDGREGTTGLQIYDRLENREDIELLTIAPELRKDVSERKRLINEADIVFLCLPEEAAREAVALAENPNTRIIDASTAHRTDPDWVYGFPELSAEQREKIAGAARVANPGCHATGFIAVTAPLVSMSILPPYYPLTCNSITGYSGGGKKMIAEYEAEDRKRALDSPRIYGTTLKHKHIAEMVKMTGIAHAPVFCPIVADYYSGMATTIMLHNALLNGNPKARDIHNALAEFYKGQSFIKVSPFIGAEAPGSGFIEANAHVGTNMLEIIVCGNDEQTTITARFDNLGKGASGAAVQNMNIMLGIDETAGL